MRKNFPQPFDFNAWYASNYDNESVNIADDFFLADPTCNWTLLACQFLVKNVNGKKIDPIFSVSEILLASKKDGWHPDTCALVIHANWLAYVKWKLNETPTKIEPAPSEPPKTLPKPDPWAAHPNMPVPPVPNDEKPKLPEIHLPQEKKNPSPTLVKFSVWFGILATAAGAAAFFFPQAKPIVAIVVTLVQSILKALGV
jgi:hypothetical protein